MDQAGWQISRRHVLFGGVAVGVLALGGGALFWPRLNSPDQASGTWHFLLPADRQAVMALAPVFLGAAASQQLQGDSVAGSALLAGVDQAIALLNPQIRGELRQLFDLLASPGGRYLLLGQWAGWNDAGLALATGMDAWQHHSLDVLRAAYDGLRDLVFAVWYGEPTHWGPLDKPVWKGV